MGAGQQQGFHHCVRAASVNERADAAAYSYGDSNRVTVGGVQAAGNKKERPVWGSLFLFSG
jgi:hypothetical protein